MPTAKEEQFQILHQKSLKKLIVSLPHNQKKNQGDVNK